MDRYLNDGNCSKISVNWTIRRVDHRHKVVSYPWLWPNGRKVGAVGIQNFKSK